VIENKPCALERRVKQHGMNVFPVGSLVRVTSYSPFRGLTGTIRIVDTIFADRDESFCFYLIALGGAQIKEPVWFECDEIELVAPPLIVLQTK
jgi:hypothetical protein